jgi:hypothetical protein
MTHLYPALSVILATQAKVTCKKGHLVSITNKNKVVIIWKIQGFNLAIFVLNVQ